jgi:hypothetical protein
MRFRTSWNEGVDVFRRAVSVDPSFHLAFDAIVSILTSPARSGCERRDLVQSCSDTSIHRRYIAAVERRGDSLVTTPRSGYTTVLDQVVESQRRSPARANIEIASRAAGDWLALAPGEGRAHKHLALLLLRLGRSEEAERELAEAMKDSVIRADNELFMRRLEIAFKLQRGADVNRLLDSMPIANPSDLGRANAAIYGVGGGRARAGDSVYGILVRQGAGAAVPPQLIKVAQQANRIAAGAVSDSLGAIERDLFALPNFPPQCGGGCFRVLGSFYTLALRSPRTWPKFSASVESLPALAPAIALAKNDTAALRRAAVVLDSISRSLLAAARGEDGSTAIAAEAYLALNDSVAALHLIQRLTDSTLQQTGIEASLSAAGAPAILLWPRAMLMRADLEAAKGSKQIAREYYTRFLALWAKADPEFTPMLERVRSKLNALR